MPDTGFIIPGNSVPDSSAIHPQYDIRPDIGMRKSVTPYKAEYTASGAEQRGTKGIKVVDRTFNVTFNNRSTTEVDYIVGFLRQKKGVESFLLTLPDRNGTEVDSQGNSVSTYEVVCDTFSRTFRSCEISSCSATFREVRNTIPTYSPTESPVSYTQGDFTNERQEGEDDLP